MATVQISTSVSIINSLLGFQAVSLSAMTTASGPTIMAGSKLEVNSAFFTWQTAETPNATSWSAISTGATAYLRCTPAGAGGSQTLTTDWSSTAPVWDSAKQGWYLSSGSSIRYIGGCFKTAGTEYNTKFFLEPTYYAQARKVPYISQSTGVGVATSQTIQTCVFEIGEWDMTSTTPTTIGNVEEFIGSWDNLRGWSAIIRTDTDPLNWFSWDYGGAYFDTNADDILMYRTPGGNFDSSGFDATASTVANRGYLFIHYAL